MRTRVSWMAVLLGLAACEPKAASDPDAGVATASASASNAPARWPALPHDPVALKALIDAETLSPVGVLRPLTVERIVAGLRDGTQRSAMAAGWRAIAQLLSKRIEHWAARGASVYVLFGSFHDAPGQLDAFRQLTGPLGTTPAPLLALEQLHADGDWAEPGGGQRGDDALLRRYLETGQRAALGELEKAQRERNYTAWKYGYVERVTDVVTGARAAGRELVGCDMPSAMQARVRAELSQKGDILRDLHCVLALRRALARFKVPHRVAIFIGDAHLLPHRLPRFLPADAKVLRIHVMGMRAFDGGIEQELAKQVAVSEPLLVPVAGARFVLLLPDARLGAQVDRVRSDEVIDAADRHQVILEGLAGEAMVGDQHAKLGATTRVRAAPGNVPFFIEQPERAIAGSLEMPDGGSVTLSLEPDGVLRIHSRAPKR